MATFIKFNNQRKFLAFDEQHPGGRIVTSQKEATMFPTEAAAIVKYEDSDFMDEDLSFHTTKS
jgi:hypothetical protein